ncbi:MAG: methyltransferase type 11 [Deltaproteobacteria bacterium RBG_13_52_11]|nr:MAG: methyltransferase type 11 [Deltaproteobacteria bacterium RBG_13_52_11]
MPKTRIVETDSGIQGEFTVATYDNMQRRLRDRGWIETNDIIKSGITEGLALEIGPGPGYLGLEWLKNTRETKLKGLDISADMIAMAERNAKAYSLTRRVEYIQSSGNKMPFDNNMFDAVFTNGSLHEWSDPRNTFNEIWRVLKTGGRIFISDLRRDMFFLMKWFLYIATKPKEIRPGLISSLNAAYTPDELKELIKGTRLADCEVTGNLIGVKITGKK